MSLSPTELDALVDDLRMTRKELTSTLQRMIVLTDQVMNLVVKLLRYVH